MDGPADARAALVPRAKALSMVTGMFALLWAVVVVPMIVRNASKLALHSPQSLVPPTGFEPAPVAILSRLPLPLGYGGTGQPMRCDRLVGLPRPESPTAAHRADRRLSLRTQLSEALANSAFGSLICPIEMTSRRNSPPRVQSSAIRNFRLNVGIRLRWYERCIIQARKPFTFTL